MKLIIDIGNSTIVVATITPTGEVDKTWRFKTLKDETVRFFRHELWAGFKKHSMLVTDIDEAETVLSEHLTAISKKKKAAVLAAILKAVEQKPCPLYDEMQIVVHRREMVGLR